jgi:hypothetical protein
MAAPLRQRPWPQKKLPRRGGWFLPLSVLKDVYAGSPLGLASGHFSAQIARRDCRLVVATMPTGNRDAGKFAAYATQLPTGCQPESLAKPARRCSYKPQRVYRCPRGSARNDLATMAIAKVIIGLAKRANATPCMARPRAAAYFDIRFNAKAHSLPAA